ncbi:MAG: pseudouridine synthase [Lachnospiraceae bacterium]|nr:pseudouridine synthase [Lachnospiraceae bacterium]
MRLDKFLASAGEKTRSTVKQILKKGCVTVNGTVVKKPETKVDPDLDCVKLYGETVHFQEYFYYMLNKPAGCVSATEDNLHPVVLDYIKEPHKMELFPVGRLDIDTVGLLLLTNDGALAHDLLSPKKHVDKTYYARVEGDVTAGDCELFQAGLDIGEKNRTLPAQLNILRTTSAIEASAGNAAAAQPKSPLTEIEVTIREGKFHQIKRMFEAVGKRVIYLKRLSMGGLTLDSALAEGEYRSLTPAEIEKLKNR